MGETREEGLKDLWTNWNTIVETKEASLKVIVANEKNLAVGRVVEELVLEKATKERDKYPKPEDETMEDTEKPADEAESTEEKAE